MQMFQLLLHKSKLILTLSIAFFLVTLLRRQNVSSDHAQQIWYEYEHEYEYSYGQIIDLTAPDYDYENIPLQKVIVYTGLYSHSSQDESIDALSRRLHGVLSSPSTSSSTSTSSTSSSSSSSSSRNLKQYEFEFIPMDITAQMAFIEQNGHVCYRDNTSNGSKKDNEVLRTYQKLISQEHTKPIAQELWKFCALSLELDKESNGGNGNGNDGTMVVYIDIDSPLLDTLDSILHGDSNSKSGGKSSSNSNSNNNSDSGNNHGRKRNYAVLGDSLPSSSHTSNGTEENSKTSTIHGSLLVLQSSNQYKDIAYQMVKDILSHVHFDKDVNENVNEYENEHEHNHELVYNPFIIGQNLYNLIHHVSIDEYGDEWIFLKQRCHSNPFQNDPLQQQQQQKEQHSTSLLNTIQCPSDQQYCCDIIKPNGKAVMMTRHITLPYQLIPPSIKDPFITSIEVEAITTKDIAPNMKESKNFFQFVLEKDCLPTSRGCELCMSRTQFNAGTCKGCAKYCSCFCDLLCHVDVEEKVVSKVLKYGGMPKYRRDPTRLIPRIVHQTWYESVSREEYPNFSRLTESWKQQSGWEYRFYNDNDANTFLLEHFPSEVKEAYNDLIPGAFKADLFRYCVLFVYGGVYADIDVMLTSKLELAIDDDIGFMIPLDSTPGKESGHTMCLWNGFIAAAPGHPILAQIIQTVVNNIRNRFTSLDIMNTLCPDVHFSVSHKYNILFTSGPCILGATVNKLLDRHPQTAFDIGDLNLTPEKNLNIPGRIVILEGNKHDMGAFRFTYTKKNLIIATTDMPNFDDRTTHVKNIPKKHYSKIKKRGQVYGLTGLYKNNQVANENIRFDLV